VGPACGERVHTEPARTIELKGIGLTPIYRVLALDDETNTHGDEPLVTSRQQVVEEIVRKCVDDTNVRNVVISGAPGSGKSRVLGRLFTSLLAQVASKPAPLRIFVARSDELERLTPYFPFRVLVDELLGLADVGEMAERRFAMSDAIQELVDDEYQALAPLLWHHVYGMPLAVGMGGMASPEVTNKSVGDLLLHLFARAAKERRIIVLVDGIFDVDEASKSIFEALVGLEGVVVIGTSRATNVGEFPDAELIQLHPLSDVESGDFLRSELASMTGVAPIDELPPEWEPIVSAAGGLPLLLRELCNFVMKDEKFSEVTPHGRRLRGDVLSTHGIDLPSSVQDLVRGSMAALPAAARTMLKACAVIGEEYVDVPLLNLVFSRVVGAVDDVDAPKVLEDCKARELLTTVDAHTVKLPHRLYRQAILESLPQQLLLELHKHVATSLEVRYHLDGATAEQQGRAGRSHMTRQIHLNDGTGLEWASSDPRYVSFVNLEIQFLTCLQAVDRHESPWTARVPLAGGFAN
jgi:AAA ATPase domain